MGDDPSGQLQCFECKTGLYQRHISDYLTQITRDGQLVDVIIKDIPELRCSVCGDRILDEIANSAIDESLDIFCRLVESVANDK